MNLHDPWMVETKLHRTPKTGRIVLVVRGMKTSDCARSVASALGLIRGVSKVEVSLQRSRAEVIFDPRKVEPVQFHTAIRAVGFHPECLEDAQAAA
ncbi:MAG TPA: heavy metal-associated domain-containing protein [Burkholderiales bacterium]|nr:heavy metal-associated domain-containing protein [Burkholderiales bacterium]